MLIVIFGIILFIVVKQSKKNRKYMQCKKREFLCIEY